MNKSFDVILTIGVIYYMLLLNMYFLHQFVLMKKMKVSFGSTTVTEKNNTTKKVKNDKKESQNYLLSNYSELFNIIFILLLFLCVFILNITR